MPQLIGSASGSPPRRLRDRRLYRLFESRDVCQSVRGSFFSPERLDTLAGHYDRKLHTQAGEVSLQVPRLPNLPFEIQIIER